MRAYRQTIFRFVAVLLGLAPFLLVELVLRGLDATPATELEDPFIGFSSVRPLFVPSADGSRYEIPLERQTHFAPDSFSATKPANEFRIFCLGGSTVQGNPYSIETSFTTWLEISLNAADPTRHWEVVNCGGISYASYRLVPILQELLARQPDLFIIYTGQNEFLEDRTYEQIKQTPEWLRHSHEQLAKLRTYQWARRAWHAAHTSSRTSSVRVSLTGLDEPIGSRTSLGPEVDALLDYRGGLEAYRRDDAWRRAVVHHYEWNLRRMVRAAQQANVPIILMNPVCNLRDSPPFKSEHRAGLSPEDARRWESLWAQARESYRRDYRRASELLVEAIAIDDQHAGLRYDLAKCYDALHQFDDAQREYRLAKELDICPLRVLESMNEAVLRVASETGTPVVDARAIFERLSPIGIPGNDWLVDHVHPSISGHQVLAESLVDEIGRMKIVQPIEGWVAERDQRYAEHVRSLPAIYYARGQQHLNGLMKWAHGRASRTRVGPPHPAVPKSE